MCLFLITQRKHGRSPGHGGKHRGNLGDPIKPFDLLRDLFNVSMIVGNNISGNNHIAVIMLE